MMKTIYQVCASRILRHKIILMLLFTTLFGVQETFASHAAGSDLTYTYIGNNQYVVTYTLYRDCDGISAPTSKSIQYGSVSCGIAPQSITLQQVPGTGQEITPNCSTTVSTCNGGTATGIQKYEYTDTVTISTPCPDWFFSAAECCRNITITTFDNPSSNDLFIDAYLNNTLVNNSSPTFTNVPIAFMCIGQDNNFNHGAVDLDGDSLVYSFIAPRDAANTPMTFNPGYSVLNPLTSTPGVTINPATGDIFMHPTAVEIAVIAVLVREYRNGVLIGQVMRDIQVYTTTCSNALPILSGYGGSNNFATSTCGGQICVDILSSDGNPGDTITMTANLSGIPGAPTFVVSGPVNAPVGRLCWTPTPADARQAPYTFLVTAQDNACPSFGSTTLTYSIFVSNMNMVVTSSPSVNCHGEHTGIASVTANGVPPYTYLWTGVNNGFTATTANVNRLYAGDYSVNVIDSTGCAGVQYFTITEPPALNLNLSTVDAGCNTQFGSATAVVTGGTGAYTYLWDDSDAQTTSTAVDLAPDNYSVEIRDANNCRIDGNVTINGTTPISVNMTTTPASCVANNGTATVNVSGGTGNITYTWTPNVSTSSTATGLITGQYECVVTDVGSGCTITVSELVANSAGIAATILASTDATCQTSEDGTATVGATGGTLPYSYLWPNGDTTASVNNLAPGTYLVRVEDYHGCRAYASVTIGFVNAAPTVNLGADTVLCIGTSILLDAGAGFTSYLWSDNSTGQTLNVSTAGTYSVLVTNASGCQNFDAIMVSFIQCPAIQTNGNHVQYNNWQAFSVYPNPFRDQFVVSIAQLRDVNVKVSVLDVLGNQLYSSLEKAEYSYSKTIDMHNFSAGIYLMRIEYGNELKTIRLVKE